MYTYLADMINVTRDLCVCIMPLGAPVVPLEYAITTRSSAGSIKVLGEYTGSSSVSDINELKDS